MNREEIVNYFREYENFKPEIIHRELKVPVDSDFIITIIGPRRAGKTYYLLQISQQLGNTVYLNFEDMRLRGLKYTEIEDAIRIYSEMYGTIPDTLLLDEIQEIEGWEIAVRTFHDLKKYRMFITGSSSRILSMEIATQLRGRTISFLLLPFSFREYLAARGVKFHTEPGMDEISRLKHILREYLEFGGFPGVTAERNRMDILREYSDLILLRDFIERNNLKNMGLARYLHESVLQNFSKEVSVNSLFEKAIGAGLKGTKSTIYDYVERLQDVVFFFFLDRYSRKAHMRASWPKKVYLADTGLARIAKFSQDLGKLMENCVFLEIMREKNMNKLLDVYYLRSLTGEVDFVIKEADRITELIQVTYNMGDNQAREMNSLLEAGTALDCESLLVVNWDGGSSITKDGKVVNVMPLWKWLLRPLGQ